MLPVHSQAQPGVHFPGPSWRTNSRMKHKVWSQDFTAEITAMALFPTLLLLPVLAAACAAGGVGRSPAVLQLPTATEGGLATRTAFAYTISPSTNGTLLAGQDLMQVCHVFPGSGACTAAPAIQD